MTRLPLFSTNKTLGSLFAALLVLMGSMVRAQAPPSETRSFSLDEAVNFALENQADVKIARFDEYIAQKQVRDFLAVGLPQLNASFNFTDNLILRTSVIPASSFQIPGTPPPPEDAVFEAKFGIQYSTDAGVSLSQLVFSGNFLLGLKAAKVFAGLSTKQTQLTREQTAANVKKAYYTALMAETSLEILDNNLGRLKDLLDNTAALNKEGFVEKIDVDRLRINYTNLETQEMQAKRQVELARDLLKFQMGLDVNTSVTLTDKIDMSAEVEDPPALEVDPSGYRNRIEFSMLQTQYDLQMLNAKRIKWNFMPTVSVFGNLGTTWMSDEFDLFSARRWYPYALVGLQASMPLYNGGTSSAQIQIAKLEAQKVEVNQERFKNAVMMETQQALTNLLNARNTLESNKRNLELANEVYRVTQIKYKEGIGSNLEVIDAESSLRTAQTNYLTALYDYQIAKIDLAKARGEILK